MSIHARGIVLDADFDRIVLQATPEEVRQFCRGSHVDVVDDREIQRHIREHAHPFHTVGPVVAVLRTKCGCEKRMPIEPGRPPRTIKVPVAKAGVSVFTNGDKFEPIAFEAREFELVNVAAETVSEGDLVFRPRYLYAEYREI